MAGSLQHQSHLDFSDPFNAGQMVGMLVMLTFIEKNNGISQATLEQIKQVTATNAQEFLGKPTEDVFLMVEGMVKEIEEL
jgi:hypothetical protein